MIRPHSIVNPASRRVFLVLPGCVHNPVSGPSACLPYLIMKKLILASALAASLIAPAFAGGLSVSGGVATSSIRAGNGASVSVPQAVLGVTDQAGAVAFGGNLAVGHGEGVHASQFSAFAGLPVALSKTASVTPYAEVGYDKIGDYRAKHVAAGVSALVAVGPVDLFGGVKAGRSFGIAGVPGAENGTYLGANAGVGFAAGPGLVQVAYDYTRLPMSAGLNTNASRFTVGYAMAF